MSEDPQPAPPRSRSRRLILGTLLVLGILVGLLLVGVHLPPVERALVGVALGRLRGPLGADIDAQSIHYNLVTRSLRVDGLRIGAPGQPSLVAASHVTVRYPWSAYRGSLDGLDVTLEDADVALIHEGGKWVSVPARWTAPGTSTQPPRPLPAFAALHLHNVAVRYEDRDAKFAAHTRGLTLDLTPIGSGRLGDLAGVIARGATSEISWYPRKTILTVAGGRAGYTPEGVGVDDLRLDATEGQLRTNVAFAFHGAAKLQVQAHGDFRGETLRTWFPGLETLKGTLAVDFRLPASSGAPAFADVAVSARNVSWETVNVDEVALRGALETGGVSLSDLRLALGGGTAQGQGRLAWQQAGQSSAALSWRDIDAGRLWKALLASSPGARYVAPGSLVSGTFKGNWTDWHAATLQARLATTWRQRRTGLERGEHLWLDGRVTAAFDRGPWTIQVDATADGALGLHGTVKTRGSAADYAQWPLSGSLNVSGPIHAVALDAARHADIDVSQELAGATGNIEGTATLSRTFRAARAAFALRGSIAWPDQPAVAFDVNATVDPAAVSIASFHATSGPSQASATTLLDLDHHTIDGQFSGSRVPIEAWLRRFGVDFPVSGLVDLTGRLSGPTSQPVIDAALRSGPVNAAGQMLSSIAGQVKYTGGTLQANDLVITGMNGGQIAGNGSWTSKTGAVAADLTAAALSVNQEIPGVTTSADRKSGLASARVDGTVHVSGTTASPVVSADLTAPALMLDAANFGATSAKVTTANNHVQLDAREDTLGVRVTGDLDLAGDRPFSATIAMRSPDSPFGARVDGLDVALGAVDLTARAAGWLQTKKLQSAELAVNRLEATVQGQPLALASGARVTWQPTAVELAGVDLSSGGTHLTASGRLDGQPGHAIQAQLTGQMQDLRPSVAPYMPTGTDALVLEGRFNAAATAAGSLESLIVTGGLTLENATVGDGLRPPVTGVNLRATLDRERLQLQVLEGHWQGAHAAVAGAVPAWFLHVPGAAHTGEATLNGHVDDVTIKVLEPFISTESLRATDFNVRIEYGVSAREPEVKAAVADVRIVDAALSSKDVGVTQEKPGHLTLRNGVATLEPWVLVAPALSTRLSVGGRVTLTGEQTVDAKLDGNVDLRSLSLLLGTWRPAGRATVSAAVTGTIAKPDVQGFATLEHGELLVRDPRLLFGDVNGTVRFAADQMTVDHFGGSLNGGSLELSGGMRLPGRGKPSGSIAVKVSGALFDIPHGLRSMVDANLTLAGRPQDNRFALAGTATIVEAAYREQLIVTGGLLSLFQQRPQAFGALAARSDQPSPIVLNITLLSNDSISIDTSYGRLEIGTNLRVLGSPSNVHLLGQADIAPGGQIYLGGHTYEVESARFAFNDPTSLVPDVHFTATTTVSGYSLTMRIDTVDGRTETQLSSDPPLPEDQIASLMVSGTRTTTAAPGDVVTQQLVGSISGELTSAVGRVIGLDSVRFETGNPGDLMFDPSLISADSNPAQRLTFSKKVLPTLEVILSQNLSESGQITYIVSWEAIPKMTLRFVQLDNQDRSYEIRHDISFGGGSAIRPVPRRTPEKVRTLLIAALGEVPESEIRKQLRITEGRTFDFYKWQKDRDKLEQFFLDRGYFEARITARREPSAPPPNKTKTPTQVDLGYTIEEGNSTRLVVNGIKVPSDLRKALIAAWTDTPIDVVLPDEFSRLLLPWLATRGYLKPTVATNIATEGHVKTATITVTPGTEFGNRDLIFAGNTAVSSSTLKEAVKQSGLGDRMWSSPSDLRNVIVAAYHTRGYLGAQVDVAPATFDGNQARLPVGIKEGPLFRVGTARVEDPGPAPAGVELGSPIPPGTILTDQLVRDGSRQVQQRYRAAGYAGTRVAAQSTMRSDKTTADLVFKVTRGQRQHLGNLTIAGVEGKDRELVTRLLPFSPGEPISLDKLNTARDRLYDTDLFRTVSLDPAPRRNPDGTRVDGIVDATVNLVTLPKYRLQYGFQLFDPYKPAVSPKWGSVDPGVVADLTRRGMFGRGITAGIAARVNPSDRVARAYLSSRRFFGHSLQTNFYFGDEWEREISDVGLKAEQRTRDFTFDQRRSKRGLQIAYGYNFEKISIQLSGAPAPGLESEFTQEANGISRAQGHISRLQGSVYFDRRDNAIDTAKGWFHSTSAEYAPEWLGSSEAYRKYLNQDFYFLPLPGTIVLASAARVELAAGPGQFFITSERLRAGGATTVRGYNDITLSLLTTQTTGRTSLIVLNEEMRFPMFRHFRGALFVDHASLFGDFDLTETKDRTSAGLGVRFVLPFILFRVDYGYPLKQDPVNNHGRWYFAIGQAF